MAYHTSVRAGDRFGQLTVVREIFSGVFLCQCDCGDYIICRRIELTRGTVKSCGCIKTGFKKTVPNNPVGLKYGNLTVVCRDTSLSGHWICRCDCGGMVSATRTELVSGAVNHCAKCSGE